MFQNKTTEPKAALLFLKIPLPTSLKATIAANRQGRKAQL